MKIASRFRQFDKILSNGKFFDEILSFLTKFRQIAHSWLRLCYYAITSRGSVINSTSWTITGG